MHKRLRRLLTPPIFEDEEKTRAAQILNTFGWITLVVMFFIMMSRVASGEWLSASSRVFFPAVIFILVLALALIHYGYVRLAGALVVVLLWAALTFQASGSDGLRDATILAYSIIVLLSALLLGWQGGLFTGLVSIGVIWLFAFQEVVGVRTFTIDPPLSYARDLTAVFIITTVLTYILIRRLNLSLSVTKLELRERLRADDKLQTQARYLTALHETTFGLLNRLELNPLLESILDRVSELLDTPHVAINLLAPDGNSLRQELGMGAFKDWNGCLISKGAELSGLVWERGETILVQDYESWEFRRPDVGGVGFYSVAGTPLKSGSVFLGALVVATIERSRAFSAEQMKLLERFAALASLAIDNARLYEESQKEIRERKTVEEDLRSSEERFRKVFNNSNIAITIVTLEEGVFLEANQAFWKLSGLTPEIALGRTSVELNTWKDPGERKRFVNDLLAKGSLENVEVEFAGNKSSLAYYELITIKNQLCILCIFYDTTEQRQAQRNLKESEERFRKVFHASPVAIVITTLDEGILLEANNAYWKLSGWNPQQFAGRPVLELGIWEGAPERERFVRTLRRKHSIFNPDYQFLNQAGQRKATIWFSELISFGETEAVLSMFYDVTEQKQTQEALQGAEARTRAILAAIPDMIFEVSAEGTLLDFMASASLTPVMEPREFINKQIQDLFPPAIAQQTMFAVERAMFTEQVHAFEYGLPPGEEIQFFEARVAPVTSKSAIIMVRDISQRKWVETEREKLIGELEAKNAELERFTYTVSHDLKSPIITIRGFLGFLEKDALSGNLPRLRSDIQRISDATDKMQTLLNELLELSRVGRLVNPSQTVPFRDIAAEALDLVQGRLAASRAQVHIQDNLPAVYGDRPRLVEALQNLVDNAAKFIGAEPQIEIGQSGAENDMPIFFVRDNGIGIPLEHHDRIFGLFNKLEADSEGTGIGLALVKRIIEAHKGRIWIESEPGAGSAFFFTLPPAPPPDPNPES